MTLNEGDGTKSMPFERVDGRYRVEDYPWLATYKVRDYPYDGESEAVQTVRDERDDYLDRLWDLVQRAAKSVEFQWPGVVEADDIAQSIALNLLESPGSLQKIADMDDKARYRAIVGIGHQLASRERASYDYYKGSYRYSVAEVKDVLTRGVLIQPVEGFDEAVFDLLEALEALGHKTPQYVEAVIKRYADEQKPENTREQDALKNGLTSLTDAMNRSNKRRFSERDDGPGTRQVITNARAQFVSAQQYSGDGEGDVW